MRRRPRALGCIRFQSSKRVCAPHRLCQLLEGRPLQTLRAGLTGVQSALSMRSNRRRELGRATVAPSRCLLGAADLLLLLLRRMRKTSTSCRHWLDGIAPQICILQVRCRRCQRDAPSSVSRACSSAIFRAVAHALHPIVVVALLDRLECATAEQRQRGLMP